MSSGTDAVYQPDRARAARYDHLYESYSSLGSFVEGELQRKS